MNVVFCNKSLRFFDSLRKVVLAETFYPTPSDPSDPSPPPASQEPTPLGLSSLAEVEFREWATSVCDWDGYAGGYLPRHTFRGESFINSVIFEECNLVWTRDLITMPLEMNFKIRVTALSNMPWNRHVLVERDTSKPLESYQCFASAKSTPTEPWNTKIKSVLV